MQAQGEVVQGQVEEEHGLEEGDGGEQGQHGLQVQVQQRQLGLGLQLELELRPHEHERDHDLQVHRQ